MPGYQLKTASTASATLKFILTVLQMECHNSTTFLHPSRSNFYPTYLLSVIDYNFTFVFYVLFMFIVVKLEIQAELRKVSDFYIRKPLQERVRKPNSMQLDR